MREHKIEHITVGDIATNCWIYPFSESGAAAPDRPHGFQNCAVIDPGDEAERIIARLRELKLAPKYILLTHGHFDHIAALPALAAACPEALIAIHRGDGDYLGPGSYNVHVRSFSAAGGIAAYIDSLWEDMPPPDTSLEEGDTIGPFTVLHLPGHTQGSAGFWDKEAKVLFSGDTLFRGDYGRTDLPGGDRTQLFASLRRLFSMDGETMVLPGHGPITKIGEEARRFKE